MELLVFLDWGFLQLKIWPSPLSPPFQTCATNKLRLWWLGLVGPVNALRIISSVGHLILTLVLLGFWPRNLVNYFILREKTPTPLVLFIFNGIIGPNNLVCYITRIRTFPLFSQPAFLFNISDFLDTILILWTYFLATSSFISNLHFNLCSPLDNLCQPQARWNSYFH